MFDEKRSAGDGGARERQREKGPSGTGYIYIYNTCVTIATAAVSALGGGAIKGARRIPEAAIGCGGGGGGNHALPVKSVCAGPGTAL